MFDRRSRTLILRGLLVAAIGIGGSSWLAHRKVASLGSPRLVSIEEYPAEGDLCYRPAHSGSNERNLFDEIEATSALAQDRPAGATSTTEVDRQPVRGIRDTAPIFSSVGVDAQRNEVYLQDSNTWSIRVFSRLDNARPGAPPTEARRVITGPKTDIQFNSCVYVDPASGDIYSVENDIGDTIVTFANNATGDAAPKSKLRVTHRAYAMAMDNDAGELFVSVQYPPQVAVYRKGASGDEKPIRLLQGERTLLSDVHGLAIDTKNKLLFVNNWGNISNYKTVGTGRFEEPSIAIYDLKANGNAPPLRVIKGSRTQLNWPAAMSVDSGTGDLYVANDMGQAIIVFHGNDRGDVAPFRSIKGSKTQLSYPTGVFVDSKNKEVWASNLGNSTATVYSLSANGDVAPLRIIRGAEEGKVSLRFGKTQALAYDSKREEILVPN